MIKVLFLLLAAGAGMLLVMWGRARQRPSTPPGPGDLATPLQRELWRQGRTPGITSTGAPSALMPVLAFELYSASGRLLYDRSRALDTAMFDLVRAPGCDDATLSRVAALQIITRGVRRQLLLDVVTVPIDPAATEAQLGRRLDAAAATIARLSTGTGA